MSKESDPLISQDIKQNIRKELQSIYDYGIKKPDDRCKCMNDSRFTRCVYYNNFTRNLSGVTALYGLMFVAVHALINPLLVVPVIGLTALMFTYSDMVGRKSDADTDGANKDE